MIVRPLPRCLLLGLALPAAALAQSVSVTVDATQAVRTVDERVFGVNAVIWDQQAASAQTISLLQAAGVRTIRVPGGSLSDEYHWSLNKSIDRNNPGQNNTWTWWTGFDGFVKIIAGLDAQAFATVNYGSGTPEEAAAWVAYTNAASSLLGTGADVALGVDANGTDWKTAGYWSALRASAPLANDDGHNFLRISRANPIGIKYWEIGNECYGSWETDLQSAPHDPTTYANRAKDYIAKMKAVDPNIKVGVVVVASSENANYNNWTPVMLARLKTLDVVPDFAIYHLYPQAPGHESDATLLQVAGTGSKSWAAIASDLRQQLNNNLGANGQTVELVVTENNCVYSDPGKQSTSLVNGLYLADSVGNMLQTEINALMWWDVRNGPLTGTNMSSSLYGWRTYGDYGILSSPGTGGPAGYYEAFPTYYAIKLLSNFARGGDTVVKATSNNNLLSVFSVKRKDGTLCLLVINKDPANSLSASIALTGFTPSATANVYSYGKPQDDAARTGTGSADVATSTMNVAGTTFTASFTSYSATVVSLTAGTTTPPPSGGGTTTPPPSGGSSGGGGGGGGGAPSPWFFGAFVLLAVARLAKRQR
jgi:alpha-N-arabinofuranosidase